MKYSFEKKIIAPEIISAEIEKLTENKVLVFSNGCFFKEYFIKTNFKVYFRV